MRAFTIEPPEPPRHEFVLEPSIEATARSRSGPGDELPAEAMHKLPKRLSTGEPVFRRIGEESADDIELHRFLEAAPDFEFYLGRLTCTLRQDDDNPFASAVIEVTLSTVEQDHPDPIAWSMDPLRLFDSVPGSRKISVSPSLTILGVGLQGAAEAGSQRERKETVLEALYERESTPTWALYRTGSTPLRGGYRFDLVIRVPRNCTGLGRIAASATVQRKRFGLITYRAMLPGKPALSFRLSPLSVETADLIASA